MKLQKTPNSYSCLLAAMSMATDIPMSTLTDEIGHTGGQIIFPRLEGVSKFAAFHPQEFLLPLMRRNFSMTHVSARPVSVLEENYHFVKVPWKLSDLITFPGRYVLLTLTHAVACDGHEFFDPAKAGTTYGMSAGFERHDFQHLFIIHYILDFPRFCRHCGVEIDRIEPVYDEHGVKRGWFNCCEEDQYNDLS